MLSEFANQYGSFLSANIIVVLCLTFTGLASLAYARGRHRTRALRTVMEQLSQGVCHFDARRRLVMCNAAYPRLYGLDHGAVRPGASLQAIVDLRFAAGTCPRMTKEEYLTWRDQIQVSDGPSDTTVELMDGRIFEIRHRPSSDGGWVATHEDITSRQAALAQSALLQERDQHREKLERSITRFRLDIEQTLKNVAATAIATRDTGAALSRSAEDTSAFVGEAASTARSAAGSTGIAAESSEELSTSINAINQQLSATSLLVGISRTEALSANEAIAALSDAAGAIGGIVAIIQAIAGQTNLLASQP